MTRSEPEGRLDGRRVLVTGATGFIGSRLCQRLVGEGAVVHATRRGERDPGDQDVEWWQGDLRDLAFVRETMSAVRPDTVLHLAALVTGSRDLEAVLPSLEHTFRSTVHLLVAAAETSRPRIVLVGSVEEPGPHADEPFPRSPYAAAKGAAASYARMFHHLYDLPLIHVRPAMVYGPGQEDPSKLVPYAIASMLRGDRPRIRSADRRADWVYVDDVVAGLIAACTTEEIPQESVELGTGELTTVREVVTTVGRIVGGGAAPIFGDEPGRPYECERPAEIGTAERELDWRARVGLEEGLGRTVAWHRERLGSPTADGA